VIDHAGVATSLCGSKTLAQLEEVAAAGDVELSAALRQAVDAIAFAATPAFTSCWPKG
jgi:aryl-alcohol dehydrogenase-like predicted oxidoreductase